MTTEKTEVEEKPTVERRSGQDRRKTERRDTARDKDKGILTTRTEDRRKGGRRKEDQNSE
jgi:hypothetical protein